MYHGRDYGNYRTRFVNCNRGVTVSDGTAAFTAKTVCAKAGVIDGDVSGTSKWVKIGGTIPIVIQGGTGSIAIRGTTTITFPVKLSNVISISVTGQGTQANNYGADVGVQSYSTSQLIARTVSEEQSVGWTKFHWLVIGTV